ncbi:N-acetyltransferase [Sorangium sp. So ce448]|uniref:GNAT family N-acetyltransferase n=1 Tax=Sorangium sp. So ce448 TaxID=3133314 RepID=UPI003F5ED332
MEELEEIALARSEDAHDILPLMVAFNEAEGIPWRPEAMIPALHRVLNDKDLGLILVARVGARRPLVGYSLATFGYDLEFAGRDAFVTEIFVEPGSRRRGLGRTLLESTVQHLRERSVNAVHLMVRPDNQRAIALYEGQGFNLSPRIMMTRELTPLTEDAVQQGVPSGSASRPR